MKIISEIDGLRHEVAGRRGAGRRIVLVATMGALHEGHKACLDVARAVDNGTVIASIFVNPTQFGAGEDLERYPRDLDGDARACEQWGCDVVFAPSVAEMYPAPQRVWVDVEGISEPMCGRSRPGHFRGVATVVAKLFSIVTPDVAVFGQKDAQQALVLREMTRQLDLPVELQLARTVREPDGLALSSRNAYLSADERARATHIYTALRRAGEMLESGDREAARLTAAARDYLAENGLDVEYADLRSAADLSTLDAVEGRVILAIAARAGDTRLIDNMVFDVHADGVTSDVALF